ncbi:MAG: profilin family protein [Promethearchaeota archaeon]
MDEKKFNSIVNELKENEGVQEVFLLDNTGQIIYKSDNFNLDLEEAKNLLNDWKNKQGAIIFQGNRFAVLKNDDIQLAAKNIAQGKGNVVGSITKEGTYLVAHTKDEGMLLEWSILINKLAWK